MPHFDKDEKVLRIKTIVRLQHTRLPHTAEERESLQNSSSFAGGEKASEHNWINQNSQANSKSAHNFNQTNEETWLNLLLYGRSIANRYWPVTKTVLIRLAHAVIYVTGMSSTGI